MHSSRMRTVRSLLYSGSLSGGLPKKEPPDKDPPWTETPSHVTPWMQTPPGCGPPPLMQSPLSLDADPPGCGTPPWMQASPGCGLPPSPPPGGMTGGCKNMAFANFVCGRKQICTCYTADG